MIINLLLSIQLIFFNFHPFHVSVCDVVVNASEQSVQVSQRIFLDDFEEALNKRFGGNIIIDELPVVKRDSLIDIYLSEKLIITTDGKEKKRTYLGSEFEEDGVWCYIEYVGVKKVKLLSVQSTVLQELFDDQANIIHYKQGEYERSVKLDKVKIHIDFSPPAK